MTDSVTKSQRTYAGDEFEQMNKGETNIFRKVNNGNFFGASATECVGEGEHTARDAGGGTSGVHHTAAARGNGWGVTQR